ncbi:MAG: ribosome maturation factor RimP [Nitrospirae bacterium]|nr:ribosome maturation factor RimP [Nitrospirota bacterium]
MSIRESIIEETVLGLAKRVAEDLAVDIAGVNLFGKGKRMIVRVAIDKGGGVTLDDCEKFSRSLELLFETESVMKDSYSLEISSPGLDRPLTSIKDFERNIGRLVRVITKERIDDQNFFLGRIISATDNIVRLLIDKEDKEIPFGNISRARLEIEIK